MLVLALNIGSVTNSALIANQEFDNRLWNAIDMRWELIEDDWEADL